MAVRDLVAVFSGRGLSARSLTSLPWLSDAFRYNGLQYTLQNSMSWGPNEPAVQVVGDRAYSENGVVFAVERRRVDLFRQASFKFKKDGAGPKPMAADLAGDAPELAPLDNPGALLERMLLDADVYSSSFQVMHEGSIRRLNPMWCTIVGGSNLDPDNPDVAWDAEPIGLVYEPTTKPSSREVFRWDEVAHFRPVAEVGSRWRGMSWMTPILSEVSNTNAYNRYIAKYWENNATPNTGVSFPPEVDIETVQEYKTLIEAKHQGLDRSFKTLFLGGGAKFEVLGSNLKDLAAKEITADQFARICGAGGVPPVVVTIVPGLESASTYANYATAFRAFADLTARPLWLEAVRALSKLVAAPPGWELWYDVSDVAALQADALDDAQVMAAQAQTMRTLVDGGYDPATVLSAVTTGDLMKLVHTGLVSVQLIPPGLAPAGAGAGDGRPSS